MVSEILKTPLYNQFYDDFLSAKPEIGNFLLHPRRVEWDKLCASVSSKSPIHGALKKILRMQNGDLKSERAQKYISDLENKNAVLVITGQQLGLFASPMYTVYKALTTIKMADILNRNNPGFSFVPVFWLESEDHDFDEVNHFGIWNSAFEPQIIKYRGTNRGKVSLRHYNFTSDVNEMLGLIESGLQKSDYTAALLEKIRRTSMEGGSWLTSARDFLKLLFESSGLLFFQPGAQEVKKQSVAFFQKFVAESKEIRRAFSSVSSELAELGYPNQVADIHGKTYIHVEDEFLQRMHLYAEDADFVAKETGKKFTPEEFQSHIENNPGKISTAVASRPVLQSWLLPVAVYVAGPAEIAYWSQLKGIFDHMRIQMPVIYPRICATLIEPKIYRYIEKHKPDISHIAKKSEDFVKDYFKNSLNDIAENPFTKANSQIAETMTAIKDYLRPLDSTLTNIVDKTNERIKQQIDQLEQRAVKAREQKDQLLLAHLLQIHSAFFPHGLPQERFASPLYFLNKFGENFIDILFQSLSAEKWDHQVVGIGMP